MPKETIILSEFTRALETSHLVMWPLAKRNFESTKAMAWALRESPFILDFRDAIQRLGAHKVKERYGNLFQMYDKITGEDPYKTPMRMYPAPHYTMGGLWVDYDLQSTVPGLFVLGEANFSDHGANRLGASALMQGLADGYFVIPYTLGNYLASNKMEKYGTTHASFKEAENNVRSQISKLMSIRGGRTVDSFHKELGHTMWEYCGMSRNSAGLKKALEKIPKIREEFWQNLRIPGEGLKC